MTDQEFFEQGQRYVPTVEDMAMYDRAHREIAAEDRRVDRINKRIVLRVTKKKGVRYGRQFQALLRDLMENGYHGEIKWVTKPGGAAQKSDWHAIKEEWVDQWGVGMEGDSFEGFVYLQIRPRLWVRIPYSC